ncbi:NADP-dependent oxidoreductase domain-containing protein [Bisporella sp. PMI_857]|nr:NADP-dependent oxidoreductase domain-containing protein [Bisporella sp. PMI_857]
MAISSNSVGLVVGTFDWNSTPESEGYRDAITSIMTNHGISSLDTARAYGGGESEGALGNRALAIRFETTTKASTIPGNGAASRENILKAANESLAALKLNKIPLYLLHGPDDTVPASETYGAIQYLFEQESIEKFGLSNFNEAQVLEYYEYAKEHNHILPTVFQGPYSPALRVYESALFPKLGELGFSIQAYSPLAMGFLSKTPAQIENATSGRWDPATPLGRMHRFMFCKPAYIKMLDEWGKLAEKSGVSKAGLAYRWVRYHSFLDGAKGDEMIVGAKEIEKGRFDDWIVEKINALWETVKADVEVSTVRAFKAAVLGIVV